MSAMDWLWTRLGAVARVQMRDQGDLDQAGGTEEREECTESRNIEEPEFTGLEKTG